MPTKTVNNIEYAVDNLRGDQTDGKTHLLTIIDRSEEAGQIITALEVNQQDLADLGAFLIGATIPFFRGGHVQAGDLVEAAGHASRVRVHGSGLRMDGETGHVSRADGGVIGGTIESGSGWVLGPAEFAPTKHEGVEVTLGNTAWHITLDVTAEALKEIGEQMAPAQRAMVATLLKVVADRLEG